MSGGRRLRGKVRQGQRTVQQVAATGCHGNKTPLPAEKGNIYNNFA